GVDRAGPGPADREAVPAHLPGARPLPAARVAPDPADLEAPRRQVAHRVAPDDQRVAGGLPDGAVQLVDHLRGRARCSRGERPAVTGQRRAHLESPTPEQVERGVVVFDEVEAPAAQAADVRGDLRADLGNGGVEHGAVARQPPGVRRVRGGEERTDPDTRARPRLPDLAGETGHVGELLIAVVPRPHPCPVHAAARPARSADDLTDGKHAWAELHPHAAAAHVGPEADALRIDVPEAERARSRAYSVQMRALAVPRRDIPGHDAIGHEAAPLEVAVA